MCILSYVGNDGARDSDTVLWPAAHDNVISVGACDDLGRLVGFSAQGIDVDFMCPGQQIKSCGMYGQKKLFVSCSCSLGTVDPPQYYFF